MKKILALSAVALTLAASAAVERLGTLQVAGVDGLVAAANQIGAFSGNTLVGLMVSSSVSKLPGVSVFGTGRPGAAMTYVAYGDVAKIAQEQDVDDDDIAFALVYPVAVPKAEFIDSNPSAKEKDGVITLAEGEMKKVVFSADGRWAAMSRKTAWAKQALADTSAYTHSAGRSAMRLMLEPPTVRLIDGAFQKEIAKLAKEKKDAKRRAELQAYAELFTSVERAGVAFDVTKHGIDLGLRVTTKKGTELSKIGLTALQTDPLAFAPPEALSANALAKDCGGSDAKAVWDQVTRILLSHGIDVSRFLEVTFKNTRATAALDVPACFAYCQVSATNGTFKTFDGTKLLEQLQSVGDGESVTAKGPAQESAFILKGFRPQYSPAQRFAAAMPDIKDLKPFSVGVCSLYACVRALSGYVLPLVTDGMPRSQKTSFEALVMSLPADVEGGLATAMWRDGDDLTAVLRISAGEIKGLAALVNVGIACSTMQSMSEPKKKARAKKTDAKNGCKGGACKPGRKDAPARKDAKQKTK